MSQADNINAEPKNPLSEESAIDAALEIEAMKNAGVEFTLRLDPAQAAHLVIELKLALASEGNIEASATLALALQERLRAGFAPNGALAAAWAHLDKELPVWEAIGCSCFTCALGRESVKASLTEDTVRASCPPPPPPTADAVVPAQPGEIPIALRVARTGQANA